MTPAPDAEHNEPASGEATSDLFSTVSPRYRFLRVIGDGLMGEVFEMLDTQTQSSVAARLITHALPRKPQKFTRTLDALSRIEHPHLVRFLEHIERDGLHYVVSEFAPGVDLLSYLRQPATAEELIALEQREDIADAGITDTQQATLTGPIEIGVDYDADAPRSPRGESAAATETLDPADSDPSLELSDLLSEETPPADLDAPFGPPGQSGLGEESASDIVESVAQRSTADRQDTLMLVLLRLDRILPQIIDALEYLHRFKKHHGDLKPGNILVDHAGRCMLVDYGIVQELRLREPGETDAPPMVREGLEEAAQADVSARIQADFGPPTEAALADSFAYRAPESLDFDETEEAGPPADSYALGCVLYEAVSNRQVFYGSAAEIRAQQLQADPLPISELEPYCPATWADVIHGLLAKDPRRRASLNEVRNLLEHSDSYAIDIPASALPARDLFLGRTEVIDSILKRFKRSYHKKTLSVSILRGPAGVGKTAVSQAVSYLLSRRGWLILSGKCYNRESLIYQGWDEIAAQLAQIFEDLPADLRPKIDLCRRKAATLFPALQLPDDAPVGQLSRLDAIDNFRSLLRRIATQRPILLLIDDMHWASWDTSALLLDLIGDPKGLSCMVLGTWLGEGPGDDASAAHPLIAGFKSAPARVTWVDLGGFSRDDAREYVLTAGAHLTLAEQQSILERGKSNPLLLEELVQGSRQGPPAADPIPAPGEGERTAPEAPAARLPDRPLFEALFDRRIEALSRRDRFVLELLSVASIPLSNAIISTILDAEFDTTDLPGENSAMAALDRLMGARLVEPVRSHQWSVTYGVAHNSYRTLILAELREQRYAHLCKRIAEGIRRCWPSAEELRFEYLFRAGQHREAADSAIRVTAEAERRFAYNRAAKLWRWLSEHGEFASLSPGIEPLAEHARLERLAHRYEQAHALYHQVAEQTPPGLKRAAFYRDEFEACVRASQHDKARQALSNALANFGERLGPDSPFAQVGALKRRAQLMLARWADPLSDSQVGAASESERLRAQIYAQALELHELLGPGDIAAMRQRLALLAGRTKDARLRGLERLYRAHHASLSRSAHLHRRVERWLDEAASLLAMAEDPQLRGLCELFRVEHFRLRGAFERAEQHLEAAAKFFRNAHLPELRQLYQLRLSYAQLLAERGDLAQSDRSSAQALHFWRGDRHVMLQVYLLQLPNALLTGQTERAEFLLDACQQLIGDSPTNLTRVWLARLGAQLNIALGRAEVSVGHLDVLAEEMHANGLIRNRRAAALLHLTLGQSLAALAERERSLIRNRRTDTLERLGAAVRALHSQRRTLPLTLGAEVARLSGRYQMLRNNPKKGLRILDDAARRLAAYPNPIQWAKCLEARAQLLGQIEPAEGQALAEQALESYARFGVHLPLFLEGWPVAKGVSKNAGDPG